jgi:hypothetical protein
MLLTQVFKDEVIPVIYHHTMNVYRGVEIQLHSFITLVLDGGQLPIQ